MQKVKEYSTWLEDYFLEQGMNVLTAHLLNLFLSLIIMAFLLWITNYVSRKFVIVTFQTFTNKTKTTFDDFLVQSNFPIYVGRGIQLFILYLFFPIIFEDYPIVHHFFDEITEVFCIILIIFICRSILRTTKNYLKTWPQLMDKPLDSFIQVFMIFVWAVGFVFIFGSITGADLKEFLISLGAASAVILLIFKDTILGLVASIQIAANDIVRIGDWISFSKYGADGVITEINLATVRVENWDHTFTTIPTYSLISDSFQNWRGMLDSNGRRIKRAIIIKQNSVKFISEADIEKYKNIALVSAYLDHRQNEINKYNSNNNIDKKFIINGRNQTNLGVFRKYANEYVAQHPAINKDLMVMVRHLAPTPQGLPLEVYCFSKDKRWENYEHIAADIFDHLIAAVPFFDLQVFETPSGDDIPQFFGEEKSRV